MPTSLFVIEQLPVLVRSPLFFLRSELWECGEAGSFDVVSGPGSLVIVRVLASESALLAAAPCVPRGHVPPGYEVPMELRKVPSSFFFIWVFGVCVCREALSNQVE